MCTTDIIYIYMTDVVITLKHEGYKYFWFFGDKVTPLLIDCVRKRDFGSLLHGIMEIICWEDQGWNSETGISVCLSLHPIREWE